MPGESPAVFGDALRRLAGLATFLYQDGVRYWYSTQPTVTKLAADRADQLKREPDKVDDALEKRLRLNLQKYGDFSRVHPFPPSGQDISDDPDPRLIVLRANYTHSRGDESDALAAAKAILELRGNSPRVYKNSLIFLAADKTKLQDLDDALRHHLAWESILAEKETLNLDPQQTAQAQTQLVATDGAVMGRIPETYEWLLIPVQTNAMTSIEWQAMRLTGGEPLAERASRQLRREESLITSLGGTRLRMELDRVPLWRGNHVAIKQLVEDFSQYVHLPRLKDSSVLVNAIRDGVALMTWEQDTFAYAESYDEEASRYRGLRYMQQVSITDNDPGVIVRPEVARKQIDAETVKVGEPAPGATGTSGTPESGSVAEPDQPTTTVTETPTAKRYHGSVKLDPTRAGRDASVIADEVIAHLAGLMGTNIKVTLEIEAEIPHGAPEHVVRTVTENSRTLKFEDSGFETE
jgi:hypothetical protein